jgi:hypothetical protein
VCVKERKRQRNRQTETERKKFPPDKKKIEDNRWSKGLKTTVKF